MGGSYGLTASFEKEKDRRIQWLKSLILDENLEHFYGFFDALGEDLNKLKETGLNDDDKKIVEDKVLNHFITFRRKFIDLILAIDIRLYESFLSDADKLQAHISETIFDSGINLSHAPKLDGVMSEKLITTKTEFIKSFLNFEVN